MLRDNIFSAIDVKTRKVEVEEWGVTLYVRTMSGHNRASFNQMASQLEKQNRSADADTWLVILTACDENGNLVFTHEDFEKLNQKSYAAITKVAREALVVNGLLPDAISEAKKN